jgi:hypothetical protein
MVRVQTAAKPGTPSNPRKPALSDAHHARGFFECKRSNNFNAKSMDLPRRSLARIRHLLVKQGEFAESNLRKHLRNSANAPPRKAGYADVY